jgi:hypothetical protein
MGNSKIELKQYDDAIEDFKNALRFLSKNPEKGDEVAQIFHGAGQAYRLLG